MSDAIFDLKQQKYLEFRELQKFADAFSKTHSCEQARALPEGTQNVRCAGRLVALRTMGKLAFAQLFDFSGKIQISVNFSEDNPKLFETFGSDVSIGDFIGVEGEMFVTKKGEITIRISSFTMLNKCLRTLPDKFHGLEDVETRYRQRYLDLIMNDESREVFKKRFAIVKSMRRYLEDDGFLEVETPVLQTQPSGALARPFFTHHNALDIQCSLRIAPETYLKRCIGAGMDKVYEFARCFRNEGISAAHLQDFTMLEFYTAYYNADNQREFVEGMLRHVIQNTFGIAKVTLHGHEIDFSKPWPVLDYCELVLADCGIDVRKEDTAAKLLSALKQKNISVDDADTLSWANLVDGLYKKVSRPKLIEPCFLVKYPAEMAPLARRNIKDPRFVDLFQFVVDGVELVKAYSELVDPIDQRARFEEQVKAREAGDQETMPMDEDFLLAMEHGFPPISGVGIGIDRLTTILCGCANIKDTVLFPLMRPL